MDTNTNKSGEEFKSGEEAFDYLLSEHKEDKRREKWAEAFDQFRPEAETQNPPKTRQLYLRIASVAAILLAVIGAFWIMNMGQDDPYKMAQKYISESIVDQNYKGDSRSAETATLTNNLPDNVKNKLALALQNEDYRQMLGIYRSEEKKAELPIRDKFYYAVSLIKIDKEDKHKAIRLLDEVIAQDEILEIEALYFRGLANLAIGNFLESESNLKLVLEKSNYKKDVINKILDHLNQ